MIWLAIGALIFVTVMSLASYLAGRYWQGWTKFRGHLATIRWGFRWELDRWRWGLGAGIDLNLAESFHFDYLEMTLQIGPLVTGFYGRDTN